MPITDVDLDEHSCKIAGRFEPTPVPAGFEAASFAKLDRLHQLILWCTVGALVDAGYWEQRANLRVGLILGLGAEWPQAWERDGHRGGNQVRAPRGNEESLVHTVQRAIGPVRTGDYGGRRLCQRQRRAGPGTPLA